VWWPPGTTDEQGGCLLDAGSRHDGWELRRERLENVTKLEGPRLFVFNMCGQFLRTVPVLARDEIDMDDVDRDSPRTNEVPRSWGRAHCAQKARHRVRKWHNHVGPIVAGIQVA